MESQDSDGKAIARKTWRDQDLVLVQSCFLPALSRPHLYGLCDLTGKFCASVVRSRVVTNNGELQCHEERKISRKADLLRR